MPEQSGWAAAAAPSFGSMPQFGGLYPIMIDDAG